MNAHRADQGDERPRPLAGLTVIDLSQVLAGPLCTMILGDLGADVIKVEPPQGDQARQSLGTRVGNDSAAFLAVNRNKRSIVLDLQPSVGREDLHRLATTADIVVENFRPGVAERLGAGYDELTELNPRLVYASLTGFGSRGPYAERAGLDLVVQAMTGLMSVTGEAGRPVKNGPPVADLSAGLYLTIGILAALESRRKTGRGQLVATSLYESALSLAVWETAELWANGEIPGPLALAVTMAGSTCSTVTLRALAKGLSACVGGSRLVRPDSHLTYVGTDMCARAARVRALSPAEVRRRRRPADPPVSRRSVAPTFSAWARRWSISGRGAELPSSQREIRSPPATSMRRANSCWVRPIGRRASRSATGSTTDSTRTNDTLGVEGPHTRTPTPLGTREQRDQNFLAQWLRT